MIRKSFANKSPLRSKNARTNAADISVREFLVPLILVNILYFLWGFAFGLLDTLNKHFQNTLGITRARSSGLQAAYFGAYPLASLGYANWILRHYGYKVTFMTGLLLYGAGALFMWPAGLRRSFGGFCGATFIIGNGLATLETAANPFMAVCGPPKYSALRITFAQAVQAIGTVVGPVLGSYAFFKDTQDTVEALKSVQWVYLATAIFVFLLAGVFVLVTIPEITDEDMQVQAQASKSTRSNHKPFWKQYRLFHAAVANWCYTGAQIAIATYFINYVTETRPGTLSSTAAKFLAVAQGCFAIGRFSGSLLMKYIRPRYVLLIYISAAIAFNSSTTTQSGNTGLALLILTHFFESVCFPIFVALGIRGLGKHTKRGAGFLVAGVSGGAAIPPILAAVADARDSTAFAMVVPVLFFIVALSYAGCVNFVSGYKDVIDDIEEVKRDGALGRHVEKDTIVATAPEKITV